MSGRQLEDLLDVFEPIELFDRVVLENGAIVFDPTSGHVQQLAPPPPSSFLEALRERAVDPLSIGRVILATTQAHRETVVREIDRLALDLCVDDNREALMVLPRGVDKGSGLEKALHELGSSFEETVGVGDAENDLTFARRCALFVAVANARSGLARGADFVTSEANGRGVQQLVAELLDDERHGSSTRGRRSP